jgi:hypothetical protein
MPYDIGLGERLEEIMLGRPHAAQKKMFGGIGWLVNGNMCVGVYKDFLIARVGEEVAAKLGRDPHVKAMDITGKPMKGWLMVAPDGYEDDADLRRYTDTAFAFASALPAKD